MSFRVTPDFKAKLDRAAKQSGRSLAQEIELRLEWSLDYERVLVGALELGFGQQVAAVMLAIGHVIRETLGRPDRLSNPERFRDAVENVNLWLQVLDPDGDPAAWARVEKAFTDCHEPELYVCLVAGAIADPEQEECAGLGPLIPIIRSWLGPVLIARIQERLGLPLAK